jgi:hypothetical protein
MNPQQRIALVIILVIVLILLVGVGYYMYIGSSSTVTTPIVVPTPIPPTSKSGSYIGCFTDDSSRTMPTDAGNITWDQCRSKAQTAGAPYFGMQYSQGGPSGSGRARCFYGGSNYSKLGSASTCTATDSAGHALGGYWSNAVYQT